ALAAARADGGGGARRGEGTRGARAADANDIRYRRERVGAVAMGGRDGQRVGPRRAARLRRRVSAATRGTGAGTGTAVCDGAAWLRAGPAVGSDRRLGSGPKVFR